MSESNQSKFEDAREFGKEVFALAKKYRWLFETLKFTASLIVGVLGGAAAVSAYLQAKVDKTIEDRFKPYEMITIALNLNRSDRPQDAAPILRDLAKQNAHHNFSDEMQEMIYDGMLYSISNIEDPKLYEPQFLEICKQMPSRIPLDGLRNNLFGWFLLRSGQKEKAKPYFNDAITWYKAHGKYVDTVNPQRGLFIVKIVEGNFVEARAIGKDMAERDPLSYDGQALTSWMRTWPRDRWFRTIGINNNVDLKLLIDEFLADLDVQQKKTTDVK